MFVQIYTMDLGYNWKSWGKEEKGWEASILVPYKQKAATNIKDNNNH